MEILVSHPVAISKRTATTILPTIRRSARPVLVGTQTVRHARDAETLASQRNLLGIRFAVMTWTTTAMD